MLYKVKDFIHPKQIFKNLETLLLLFSTSNAKAINNESVGERIKREKQAKELRMQIKDDFILKHELEQRCFE